MKITAPVNLIDLLPTFCDLAGVSNCAPHDGHSLLSLIEQRDLRPADDVMDLGEQRLGADEEPLAMADEARRKIAIYFPSDGSAQIRLAADSSYIGQWYDTRNGSLSNAVPDKLDTAEICFSSPGGRDANDLPLDWVLLLMSSSSLNGSNVRHASSSN